jgi:hypothetical protein
MIESIKTDGKWVKKKEQVYEKGVNIVAMNTVNEDEVIRCHIFIIE